MNSSFFNIDIIQTDQDHLLGRVNTIVSGSVVDGPGIRYVIFLQGCQFKCLYCHNRDTWDMDAGKLYTVGEIMDDLLSYTAFYDKSRGGVTLSGGEALLQPDFVNLLFRQLKSMDINTCLDTNGYVTRHLYGPKLDSILENTDLVMLDIKHMDQDKHHELTGINNEIPLNFARHLHKIGQKTRIRYVVVPGYSDDENDIRALAEFIKPMDNVQLVELLPYHKMGKHKWEDLGQQYPLEGVEPPSKESMLDIKHMFENEYGIKTLL